MGEDYPSESEVCPKCGKTMEIRFHPVSEGEEPDYYSECEFGVEQCKLIEDRKAVHQDDDPKVDVGIFELEI